MYGMEINPFEENNFVNISNTSVFYNDEIKKSLKLILSKGEAQFQMYLKEQLIDRIKSVDAPIKKNNYKLPKNANDAIKEKLTYSPAIMNKLRECIRVRAGKAEELFKTELFNVTQSIVEDEDSLYHSSKSKILKRFKIKLFTFHMFFSEQYLKMIELFWIQ